MNKLIKIVLFLLVLVNFIEAKDKLVYGLLYDDMFINKKEAKIGANIWLKEMNKKNLDVEFEVVLYNDEKKILNDYEDKKICSFISGGLFYHKNKTFLDTITKNRWIINSEEDIFQEYYLIKNKKNDFKLKNTDANTFLYLEVFGKIWLESLLLNNGINLNKVKKNFVKAKSEKNAIFDVLLKKKMLAVVSNDAYSAMISLNPKLKEDIEIVKKSEKIFFRGIGLTRSELDKKTYDILNKVYNSVNDQKVDFGVLSLFQIQRILLLKEDELKPLNEFYKQYEGLKIKNEIN